MGMGAERCLYSPCNCPFIPGMVLVVVSVRVCMCLCEYIQCVYVLYNVGVCMGAGALCVDCLCVCGLFVYARRSVWVLGELCLHLCAAACHVCMYIVIHPPSMCVYICM